MDEANLAWQSPGEYDVNDSRFGDYEDEDLGFFRRFQRRLYSHVRAQSDDSGIGSSGSPNLFLTQEQQWYELQRDLVTHFANRFAANEVRWV
jgi:hypothetical protein